MHLIFAGYTDQRSSLMLKYSVRFVLVLMFILPMGFASAQTPPLGSKEDNACNPGGAMEGKCGDNPWAWVCGWYLARWQSNGGWLTPNNPFNDACLSLLPPRPISAPELPSSPFIGCQVANFLSVHVNFGSSNVLAPPVPIYSDASCSTLIPLNDYIVPLVYAANLTEALALCQSNFGIATASVTSVNANVFLCA
jgi:hypothetical protein